MNKQETSNQQYYEKLQKRLRSIKLQEPAYEDHRWTEENLGKYMGSVEQEDRQHHKTRDRKMFFSAETGNVLQNDYLIAAVVSYKNCGFLTSATIDKLLSYEKPIFRVEVMVETEPGSCKFMEDSFDLLETVKKNDDQKLLQELAKYDLAAK